MLAIVGAVGERPKYKTLAPHTLNTYVSAMKLSNFTHRRVKNQPQEVLSGSVVSACCKDRQGAVMSSLHLRHDDDLKKWLTWSCFSKIVYTRVYTRGKSRHKSLNATFQRGDV